MFGKGKKLMHWYMTQVQNIPNLNFLYPKVYSYNGSANTDYYRKKLSSQNSYFIR